MESRFGFKDLFLFLLLIVLIVVVVLAMVQYDRQWEQIQQTKAMVSQQTSDLSRIRSLLERGGGGSVSSQPTTQSATSMAGFESILAAQAMPGYAAGDNVVSRFGVVPDKLTPLISTDAYSADVQGYVLDSLCDRDPNTFKWLPRVALSWTISPDGLTIDFILRRGVTFSDGSDLTADDVVFTYDQIRNPKIEAPRARSSLDKLGTVTAVDPYHVRFVFKEPYFQSFDVAAGTQVLSRKFYSEYTPQQFNGSTGLLMGSGPYRLEDPTGWKPEPGKPVQLVRNERYWGPTPTFNKLVWRVIEEPSSAAISFGNGELDVFGPTPDQYDKLLADPAVTARTHHFDLQVPNAGFRYIGWNEKQGRDGKPSLFADARVRRAMTMLIDRQAICKTILKGYASPISGPFSDLTPQGDPSIKPFPYDPAAAEKLLDEAGFTKRGDQLVSPDGMPFTFKLTYPSKSADARRMVSFIRDACVPAGILVQPDPAEWSIMLKRIDDRNYDAITLGWTGGIEFDAYQIFDSSQIAGTGDDFVQYKNPACDAAIEQARATVDEAKRMPLWHQVQKILHEDQPYTFLVVSHELAFVVDRLHNVEPTKTGLNPPLEWFVPVGQQKYTN